MLALDAGRVLNIKVSRMGGLTAARRAHDVARDAGVPVWCGGMHEFGVGRAANVALSSLPGFTLPSDVSGSDKYYARDVIVPPVVAEGGRVTVPASPGSATTSTWTGSSRTPRGASTPPQSPSENEGSMEPLVLYVLDLASGAAPTWPCAASRRGRPC